VRIKERLCDLALQAGLPAQVKHLPGLVSEALLVPLKLKLNHEQLLRIIGVSEEHFRGNTATLDAGP